MKKLMLLMCCLSTFLLNAQVISTFAGNGTAGNTGDGNPATAASINYPCGGVFDKFGNYYFGLGSIGCSVRKISPTGVISTVAGITGTCGYGGDGGAATSAILENVQAVTVDTFGNIYIADADVNNRIRKVDIATGIITTIAGTGVGGYNGDGIPATVAEIYNPLDLCFDKYGNLYIADYGNARVRKIDASGIITTIAGNGTPGTGSTGVPATSVSIGASGICFDSDGNLYIGDSHARVYKVNTSGIIAYYVGNGTAGFSGDGGMATNAETEPYKVEVDKFDNLFLAEYQADSRVRMINESGYITTIVGTGIAGYNGDSELATAAELNYPAGLALDTCDNLYIADSRNWRIRKITYPYCNYLGITEKVAEVTINNEASIYPNPTYDILNINNLKTPATYRLLSIVGAAVQQGALKEGDNTISIQSIPSGMYLLEITPLSFGEGQGEVEQRNRTVNKIVKQ